ncbi:MAG: hypothetical protein RSE13_04750 [Planktothrix sp. GU0601_MAG3]|nr:MAG: hypothetical protein RSE13_04750 [Planktothrix sp. GU0601_MAG3]
MTLAQRIAPEFSQQQRYFQRRDQLPSRRDHLWKIESGVVRTFTYLENGNRRHPGFMGRGGCGIAGFIQSRPLLYGVRHPSPGDRPSDLGI